MTGHSPRANGVMNNADSSPLRQGSPRRRALASGKNPNELESLFKRMQVIDAQADKLRHQQRKSKAEDADVRDAGEIAKLEEHQRQTNEFHQRMHDAAMAAIEEHNAEQERERQRQAEQERLRLEREAQAKVERERRAKEDQERQERERREAEQKAQAEVEQKRQEQARAAAEKERKQQEAEALRVQQEQQRLEHERQQQQAKEAVPAPAPAPAPVPAPTERAQATTGQVAKSSPEAVHREYIQYYHKLKEFKNDYSDKLRRAKESTGDKEIVSQSGELRRALTGEVGKLSEDKEKNRKATNAIKDMIIGNLRVTAKTVGVMVKVNDLLPPSLNLNDNDETEISDLAAYLLCILVQRVVHQFHSYAHGEPQRAEPIGTMVVAIFGAMELKFERRNPSASQSSTQTLFPIMLAKYHRVCPVLFGITGDPKTMQGRHAMGWALTRKSDEEPKNVLITEGMHFDRMKGLAFGYSAMVLRNFSTSKLMEHPYPPYHFWRSLAMLVNLPPEQITSTHICVLRYMFGHTGMGRFLLFFGDVGFAALREAYVELPKRLPDALKKDPITVELSIYLDRLAENDFVRLT